MSKEDAYKHSGQVCEDCQPLLVTLSDEVAGLVATTRSQAATIGRLKRDPEAQARGTEEWKRCERLFDQWRRITKHPNSRFTLDRFQKAKPLLNAYDDDIHIRAYLGAEHDPYEKRRANGTLQRYTGWNTIYKNADTFEEYANRAPLDWRDTLEEHAKEVARR